MSLRSVRTMLLLLAVFALFASSFQGPAIYFRLMATDEHHSLYPQGHVVKTGTQMLLSSVAGPFFGNFAGMANPMLIVGCTFIVLRRSREAMRYLGLAVLFALQTFQLMVLPYHEDEGGVMQSYMVHPLAGWYRWFGAILLALAIAVEQHWSLRRQSIIEATKSR